MKKMDKKENQQNYLPQERIKEIQEVFKVLNIPATTEYPGTEQFTRRLEKVTRLQYEGIQFSTSGSSHLIKKD